jgi:hypothetical protein
MLRIFSIAIICICLLATGCYAPRSYAPLEKEHWPEKVTAVMPVSPDDIRSDNPDFPAERVAQVANAVINTGTKSTKDKITGTKSTKDKIVGPTELLSILGDEHSLKDLTDSLNAPLGENWKVQELSKFSKRTGIETIVRTNIKVDSPLAYSFRGETAGIFGKKVVGYVEVNAELIDLSFNPPKITYRSTGDAKHESKTGIMVGGGYGGIGILPFAYGSTFGRAVDQATREALSKLFHQKSKPNDRFIKHVSGLVRDESTDLEWVAGPDIDTTLDEAKSWVKNLSIDGGGWRLPTIMELKTLNHLSFGECSITPSLKTSGWWVWTLDFHHSRWQYDFVIGFGQIAFPLIPSARGFAVRFKKNDDTDATKADFKNEIGTDLGGFVAYRNGMLLDRETGLEWIFGPDKNTTWNEAKSWVENLNKDNERWRMPTIEELKTLHQNLAGAKDMATVLNTSGLYVWSGGNHSDEEIFTKISLFNCRESSLCCDSSKRTRCFAVRPK